VIFIAVIPPFSVQNYNITTKIPNNITEIAPKTASFLLENTTHIIKKLLKRQDFPFSFYNFTFYLYLCALLKTNIYTKS